MARQAKLSPTGLASLALALSACAAPAQSTASSTTAPGQPEPTAGLTARATATAAATATPQAQSGASLASLVNQLRFSTGGWKTDFSKATVPLSDISSGGPPRDGIPPIDRPQLVAFDEAGTWLKEQEPVVSFELNGDARAYPLQILIWHEIVNDTVSGTPVAVTFCPLCNTAIAFDRQLDGQTLRFGTTGNLRYSDLVMWSDDPGETWWQQITGEAIIGALAGKRLTPLPAQIISFADFKTTYPQGRVLGRQTGFNRAYGTNPYVGYDDVRSSPFLYAGPTDQRLPPMERVVAVELGNEAAAFPFRALRQVHVVNDTVGGKPVVVLHRSGTVSALDGPSISTSQDIGAAGVFERTVEGRRLTFRLEGDRVKDAETGSSWDVSGSAVDGPLAGQRLAAVLHGNHFWFAWSVFKPQTRVWAP